MRSASVRCPECNAALEAGAESREVRCAYCGTLVVIQRRTLFLQRPEPLPSRAPAMIRKRAGHVIEEHANPRGIA